ncbi:MAG: hypothetical protein Q8K93_08995, partial [Reyranella sp.]|nr:hypothetical protein [Reyranella sp.]
GERKAVTAEDGMPIRAIGTIGVTPSSGEATVHVVKGGLSPAYLRAFAQAHDTAGFDLALVSYTASSAEGFLVAQTPPSTPAGGAS